MEGEESYEKMAEQIDSIEASRSEAETSIDVNEVLANRLSIKKISYNEADRLLEGVKATAAVPQQASQPSPQPRQQPQAPKRELKKETKAAAGSLRSMIGGAGKEFSESVSAKVEEAEEAKLAMPKLSLQDQVSELEKIEEGIDEKVFDREQIGIIGEEVRGLSKIAAREDTSRMSEEQRELVLMRNQRIKEIKGRLNIR
ncbi:MAG: hypothetical protein KGH57_00460 [Candidatus Micrarchaeota archaeon]|nr:hypothetical protein [Candidatus Micrarchaeota archaeon]